MADLFSKAEDERAKKGAPLADRMRPRRLEEFVGQAELVGEGRLLRRAIDEDTVTSMIFWGPPGTGKTTLARIIAAHTKSEFVPLSAVTSGVKDVRGIIVEAERRRRVEDRRTILFIDEIHRFNKSQQDAFLPHVESGAVTLIGATTENPSFEVIGALLSRCRVFVLKPLAGEEVGIILDRAVEDKERGLGSLDAALDGKAREFLIMTADGDARVALNALELAALAARPDEKGGRNVTLELAQEAMQKKSLLYDKAGEGHYNAISALHKSLRSSDVQGGLYWLARMMEAGEDPLYIARRLVRFASEDVGLADPQALSVAIAARDSYHFLGSPEGDLALAQAAVYLATAPKSNALYVAYSKVLHDVRTKPDLPVPLHIRNAPTKLMAELGYGDGYKYDHNFEYGFSGQECLPDNLKGTVYYKPGRFGFEKEIAKRIEFWENLRKKIGRKEKEDGSR